jgi:hypothetical protein
VGGIARRFDSDARDIESRRQRASTREDLDRIKDDGVKMSEEVHECAIKCIRI